MLACQSMTPIPSMTATTTMTTVMAATSAIVRKYKIKIAKKLPLVQPPVVEREPSPSKNSEVAKKGFKAEDLLCESDLVKRAFESYFAKAIKAITKVPKRKKSDLQIEFEDGTIERVQTKDGKGGNRGWSCDRRSVDKYPLCEEGKRLLRNICLKQGEERPEVPCPDRLIEDLFLGTDADAETAPTYFCHTQFDKDGQLESLSLCTTEVFIGHLKQELYKNLLPKRTCVHLSPRIYLQRKGGGQKDHAPNDIQLKITSLPMDMYTLLYPASASI